MKSKHAHAANAESLAELRQREKEVALRPTTVAYLELADHYHALGYSKDSDRLAQLAEALENAGSGQMSDGLMSGTADALMLIEVIQILSRTRHSGDLIIDSQQQSFHLYFDQGQIINATSQCHPAGVESFRMALKVSSGTYRFVAKPLADMARLIEEPTDFLLLDAMHNADKETEINCPA